jgi:hypothetical protein
MELYDLIQKLWKTLRTAIKALLDLNRTFEERHRRNPGGTKNQRELRGPESAEQRISAPKDRQTPQPAKTQAKLNQRYKLCSFV